MSMLEAIKAIFKNTSGTLSGNASNSALAEYYQSRLKASNCAVEVEAILSMNALMRFDEQDVLESEQSK